MELYLTIVKAFLSRAIFEKYHDSVDYEYLKSNFPDVLRLFHAVEALHKDNDDPRETFNLVALEAAYRVAYPRASEEVTQGLFQSLLHLTSDVADVVPLLDAVRSRSTASKIAFLSLDFAEGKVGFEEYQNRVGSLQEAFSKGERKADEIPYLSDELESLYLHAVAEGGLSWRLRSLNVSLGPLRKGDFGFIFARPETGKTTFLASETTHMAGQLDEGDTILWFNNEEQGEKVLLRCYEAALGVPLGSIVANKAKAQEAYYHRTKRAIRLIDNAGASWRDIERLAKQYRPKLIVADQLDKVKGFDADREDLRMGAIYQWARELAKDHCPVIGVSQSDGTGEGIKYLSMGNVANAKTAKQAEADWILGIGRAHEDMEHVRGFSICKNKLIGGPDTVPAKRHGRWDVLIEPEIGRYRDMYV